MRGAIAPLFVGLVASLPVAPTLAQSPKEEFGIRQDEPPLGSNIRRYAVRSSKLPINKQYSELTADEKSIVNGWYERVEPGDEPPFPADGLRPILDAISRAQGKLRVRGELFLIVDIAADGKPTQVKAVGSPSREMTNFAGTVLLLTKYKPAVCGGQPCRMEFPLRLLFRVE